MYLNDDEATHAAQILCESGTGQKWSQLNAMEKQGYIQIVRDLAASLTLHKTPAALRVFYLWMGEKP